jgi:hypothetical protein
MLISLKFDRLLFCSKSPGKLQAILKKGEEMAEVDGNTGSSDNTSVKFVTDNKGKGKTFVPLFPH